MGASMAAGTILVEVASIGVACKDHGNCTVCDSIDWVRDNKVEGLMDRVSSGLGGSGLLGANGAESNNQFVVDHTSIPQ